MNINIFKCLISVYFVSVSSPVTRCKIVSKTTHAKTKTTAWVVQLHDVKSFQKQLTLKQKQLRG